MAHESHPATRRARIATAALPHLRFEHVSSAVAEDASHEFLTGSTRWRATEHQVEITLHWAWGRVSGLIVVVNPAQITTNVVLVDANGNPERSLRARAHLLEHIETLPWRDAVRPLIEAATRVTHA
jgi:hypothetical protein